MDHSGMYQTYQVRTNGGYEVSTWPNSRNASRAAMDGYEYHSGENFESTRGGKGAGVFSRYKNKRQKP